MWADPIAEAEAREAEWDNYLASRPVCECCGYPITEDSAINYEEMWYCDDCEKEWWELARKDYLDQPTHAVRCAGCGEDIPQQYAVYFNGKWYCEDCEDIPRDEMKDYYTEQIDD